MNRKPYLAVVILVVIVVGCVLADLFIPYDPTRMMLDHISQPPSGAHLFGTDSLGRDLFSVIWHGGRISIAIGLLAGLISTAIALLYGTAAGLAAEKPDDVMMRLTEILMSIPQILLVIFLQAIWGEATVLSVSVVIGITGWMAVAKMVRSEVKQLRNTGFVLAARTMGTTYCIGGMRDRCILYLYIMGRHLLPNCLSAVMFMIVTNIGSAIALEATLSFMGLGLPTEIISWGSLMSLSQRAMLTGAWWMLLIPGGFLVTTLICITEIGEYLRKRNRRNRLI